MLNICVIRNETYTHISTNVIYDMNITVQVPKHIAVPLFTRSKNVARFRWALVVCRSYFTDCPERDDDTIYYHHIIILLLLLLFFSDKIMFMQTFIIEWGPHIPRCIWFTHTCVCMRVCLYIFTIHVYSYNDNNNPIMRLDRHDDDLSRVAVPMWIGGRRGVVYFVILYYYTAIL